MNYLIRYQLLKRVEAFNENTEVPTVVNYHEGEINNCSL